MSQAIVRCISLLAIAAGLVLAVVACQTEDSAIGDGSAIQSVTFVANDYSFEGPATLPSGLTEVRLQNEGQEVHHIQLALLDEGKTLADVGAAMADDPHAVPDFMTLYGGPNGAMPGESVNAYVDLVPGEYAIICLIPSPDGITHAEKGMVGSLTVEDSGRKAVAAPEADIVINGLDFAFEVEDDFVTGDHTISFKNQGDEPHEIVFVQLDEGASAMDFAAAFGPDAPPGPPPGRTIGGTVGIEPGDEQSFDVTLVPGSYAIMCFFPESTSGAPHFVLGMVDEFTIQ